MGSVCCDVLLGTLLLACVRGLWAQAPGDEDVRCVEEHSSPPTYPDTERNLMDSYNYEQLLPGNGTGDDPIPNAVWNDYSFDDNDITPEVANPTYWQQRSGGLCRFQPRVCGWKRGTDIVEQNNWLFTQHISKDFDSSTYNYNVTIHVAVAFSTPNCRERSGCKPWLNLHHYMTNSVQLPSTEGSGYMNSANYVKFGAPKTSNTILTYTFMLNFTLPSSSTGFYIAAQDSGGCITLSRMRVYRGNCKAQQIGLVQYPDAPPPSDARVTIPVSCVPNSSFRGSGNVTCGSDGNWGSYVPVCVCDEGFEQDGNACDLCKPGYFKSEGMDVCTPCPANSHSEHEAATECECVSDHYRAPWENITLPCTAAPTKPTQVMVEVTNTTVKVLWGPPESNGGRTDVYFIVTICEVIDCIEQMRTTSDFNVIFEGLKPTTKYRIVVQAENGVSDQDDRVDLRKVVLENTTAEGRPEEPHNPTAFSNVVVLVWGPPKVPNGQVTGYEVFVEFCPTEDEGSGTGNETELLSPISEEKEEEEEEIVACVTQNHAVGPDTLFLVVTYPPDFNHNLTYSIRAKTGEDRLGDWSLRQTILPDFIPTPPPPTCPTVECNYTTATPSTPTTPTTPTTTEEPTTVDVAVTDESKQANCGLEECVIHMSAAAAAMLIIGIVLSCIFSCTIACLCHKHKMKTYKIRVKKHMQSKWDY